MSLLNKKLASRHSKNVLLSAIALSAIVLSALFATTTLMPNSQSQDEKTENRHFSVKYQGFIPGYDASYPDYYIAINELEDPSMQMGIRLFIQNQEASGYYFKIDKNQTPPAGWVINPQKIGHIDVDGTKDFVYDQMWRTTPTSIPEGRLTETIYLAAMAYYDAGYMSLYSQDTFNVTFHFIDRTSPVWTTIYLDNFDDGTTQGWSGNTRTDYYRSFRYSLYTSDFRKTYYIAPGYTESYLVFAMRFTSTYLNYPYIYIDDTLYFQPDVKPSAGVWYQFVIPLHIGSTSVRISTVYSAYMDDAFVIAM